MLGGYTLTRQLGQGGMGVVFLGTDPLGTQVAIKVCHSLEGHSGERFSRECASLARIKHPNVVGYLAGGLGPPPFLVMEHVAGESLGDRLRHGPLEVDEARRVCAEAAAGIAAAHALGIQHRDVKPDNVLLRASDGTALIADFGLTRTLEAATLTRSGILIGTLAYAAPEQARGERTDFAADAWSLGALLFHCLTGRPPFLGENQFQLALQVVEGQVPRLRSLAPSASADLEALCHDCLQRDPAARPSAAEIASRLSAAPPPQTKRGGRAQALALAGALIVTVGAVLLSLLLEGDASTMPTPSEAEVGRKKSPRATPTPAPPLPPGWRSTWVGPAGATLERGRLWANAAEAAPLSPSARSDAFAGVVKASPGGRLEVRYPAREVRFELENPARYVVIADQAPTSRVEGDRIRYSIPADSHGIALCPGSARWEAPSITWDLAFTGMFRAHAYSGVQCVTYSRRGPRAYLSHKGNRVELAPFPDGAPRALRIGASREGEPPIAYPDDDLAAFAPELAGPMAPGTHVLLVYRGELSLGPTLLSGRPLRVDRPAVALTDPQEGEQLLIQARYECGDLNAESGPFLLASWGPERLAVERREGELALVSLRRGRRLLSVPCPVSEGPEQLELELRGPLVRGRLRSAGGRILAEVGIAWEGWKAGPTQLGFGSSGPRVRFERVEVGLGSERNREREELWGKWATLSQGIAGLTDPVKHPELCGPSRQQRRFQEARRAGLDLEALLPRLDSLALPARARILQAAIVGAQPGRAQGLARRLRKDEAGIEEVRATVDRLAWSPGEQRHSYLDMIRLGPTVDREDQGLLAAALAGFELLPTSLQGNPARVYADVVNDAYKALSPSEKRSPAWKARLEEALAQLRPHAPGHGRLLGAQAGLCISLERFDEALACYDEAVVLRDYWYDWGQRARVLARLGRRDEQVLSLFAMLASQPTKPESAISHARSALVSGELRARRPGLWAVLNLAALRMSKASLSRLGEAVARLPTPSDPREQDLLDYVRVCVSNGIPPSGERPFQVLARARAGDPKARAALADLARQDLLLRCVARSDPDLIVLVPQRPFPPLR